MLRRVPRDSSPWPKQHADILTKAIGRHGAGAKPEKIGVADAYRSGFMGPDRTGTWTLIYIKAALRSND